MLSKCSIDIRNDAVFFFGFAFVVARTFVECLEVLGVCSSGPALW